MASMGYRFVQYCAIVDDSNPPAAAAACKAAHAVEEAAKEGGYMDGGGDVFISVIEVGADRFQDRVDEMVQRHADAMLTFAAWNTGTRVYVNSLATEEIILQTIARVEPRKSRANLLVVRLS